jgi:CRISPR-associated protein Csy3
MTTLTLPSVLAFDRKLEPSDALMHSGRWNNINDNKSWAPIELFERRNRAVHSNFTQEVLDDEDALQKMMSKPNLSWGDDASLNHEHDTLKISFTLRVVSGLSQPSVCNKVDFGNAYRDTIEVYAKDSLQELAKRYAYNIVNGRFLWRNRVGAQEISIVIKHPSLDQSLEFNAYDFSLKQTSTNDKNVLVLADLIKSGLVGDKNTLLTISAFVKLGEGQRVWPSQEMVLNSPAGEKSRYLFSLNGIAAMHCEKIGNALRTVDDWYPEFKNTQTPIAIEAYGAVTQRGVAYRSTKNDFKTLLLKWLNADDKTTIVDSDKHFVAAMIIRGGVFGEGES